ncbi:hypothetical protein NADFUDRAFT_84516 [Nadsonia fulvescens var. elongata DSM 6958]|uniref:SART-1 protein n=1 Tax=Nadsonia fulvescens var. elongata DSM 6958 TaxID=857566 RepID=A0A1E3PEM8_9ASCO|nr:hypothetical protein NADFUDRAFT_84516 [Nadsonia fulvescens var. elongata DSM 6958]
MNSMSAISSVKKTSDEIARENWVQSQKETQRKENETKLMKKIRLAKERAEKNRLLGQKSLGESAADVNLQDTDSWLKSLGRRQKLSTAQRTKHSEENKVNNKSSMEEGDSGDSTYGASDLAGLKVGHSLEDLTGFNNDVILTLKDGHVLDEDEDELVSELLVEKNKASEASSLKKGQLLHDGYDNEADEGILSKYDDVIMGKQDTSFVLTGDQNLPKVEKTQVETPGKPRGTLLSLNLNDDDEGENLLSIRRSNYEDIKPKKLKKKNFAKLKDDFSKRRRIKTEERVTPTVLAGQDEDSVIVDDDDLQTALAINRRKLQKKRKISSVDDIVDTIISLEATPQYDEKLQSGMIINDTTEFLSNLQTISVEEAAEDEDKTVATNFDHEDLGPALITKEKTVETIENEPKNNHDLDIYLPLSSVFEDEPSISANMGLSDVFNMAKQQGFIKVETKEEKERKQLQREQREVYKRLEKQRILAEIEQKRLKENELNDARLNSLSTQEKEDYISNKNRKLDMEQARIAQKMLENYKPDVKLEYKDEFGNELNQREAYKQLSHAFHGKGPGKGRIEKKLKRMEEERKMEKGQGMSQSVMDAASSERKASVRLQ